MPQPQQSPLPIVFIHAGGSPPKYAATAVRQARRWNPDARIVFLATTPPSPEERYGCGEEWVRLDTIPLTSIHERFRHVCRLFTAFRDGFWLHSTERLYYLYDWLIQEGVSSCFHLEYDNMLYCDVGSVIQGLEQQAPLYVVPLAAEPTPSVSFGVCYIQDRRGLKELLIGLATSENENEMVKGGAFAEENPDIVGHLPACPPGTPLRYAAAGGGGGGPWVFETTLSGVFDAAQYGQYLGGPDPRNDWGFADGGYVNTTCEFRADAFTYEWRTDEAGRRYPGLLWQGKFYPIYNLHIHCKRLEEFA